MIRVYCSGKCETNDHGRIGGPSGRDRREKGDRGMARKFFLFLMILCVSVVLVSGAFADCNCEGNDSNTEGRGEGDAAALGGFSVLQDGMKLLGAGNFVEAGKTLEKSLWAMDPKLRGDALRLLLFADLGAGEYDRGKVRLEELLSRYGDARSLLVGDGERVRGAAVLRFVEVAAERGNVADIDAVRQVLGPALKLDWVTVVDATGHAGGRTKLFVPVEFARAQALVASGRNAEAEESLQRLSFSAGRVLWKGRALDLDEAMEELRRTMAG